MIKLSTVIPIALAAACGWVGYQLHHPTDRIVEKTFGVISFADAPVGYSINVEHCLFRSSEKDGTVFGAFDPTHPCTIALAPDPTDERLHGKPVPARPALSGAMALDNADLPQGGAPRSYAIEPSRPGHVRLKALPQGHVAGGPTKPIRSVTDNQGIITQGQKGDNSVSVGPSR